MKKGIGITTKFSIIVIISVFLMVGIITGVSYKLSYDQVMDAAGVELIGCANITTGLINPKDIEALSEGKMENAEEIGKQINWTVQHKPIFTAQYILSLDGRVLAGDDLFEAQGFNVGDSFYIDPEALQMITEHKHPEYSKIYTFGGKDRLTGYAPIFQDHDPSKKMIALNAIDFDASIVSERTWQMMKGTVLLGIVLPIIAAIAISIFVRKMMKPILLITQYVKRLANGDLTVGVVKVKTRDEIGELALGFNTMVVNLKQVIGQVRDNAHIVSATAIELAANSEQTSKTAATITNSIQQVSSGADHQLESATLGTKEVTSVSNEMMQMNKKMETVIRSTDQATHISRSGNEVVSHAIQQMNQINEHTQQIDFIVRALHDKSQLIGNIVTTITEIAAHTKILALNAAIEASRAGEHGKGFAVVASEVRKLADETGQSADQIVSLIGEIQKEIAGAVVASKGGTSAVNQGIRMVSAAGQSFEEIETAVEGVSDYIGDLTKTLLQVHNGMQSLVEVIDSITRISESTSANSQSVAFAVEEQYASMEEVSAATITLSKMAEDLQNAVSIFKT